MRVFYGSGKCGSERCETAAHFNDRVHGEEQLLCPQCASERYRRLPWLRGMVANLQ